MEALREIQMVESNTVIIKDLDKFKGKKVEILVFPYDAEPETANAHDINHLFGSLKSEVDGLEFQKSAREEW